MVTVAMTHSVKGGALGLFFSFLFLLKIDVLYTQRESYKMQQILNFIALHVFERLFNAQSETVINGFEYLCCSNLH